MGDPATGTSSRIRGREVVESIQLLHSQFKALVVSKRSRIIRQKGGEKEMAVAANKVGEMLREGLEQADIPVKSLAIDVNYSEDAIYAAMKGKRKIPREARQTISEVHLLAGLAVAYEATGYRCFRTVDGDMHPQNILQKALKEDRDVDRSLEDMGFRLIDKQRPEDLTEEDRLALSNSAKEVIEEIRALLVYLISLESSYHIGCTQMLIDELKKKDRSKRPK